MAEKVECGVCGRSLGLLEQRLSYKQDGTSVCPACYSRICAEGGISTRFKVPTVGKTAAKLLFGVLFVATCPGQSSVGAGITAIVIGFALIAWALVPVWWYRTNCDAVVAQKLGEANEASSRRIRCRACGGVSSGPSCEYCGSPLDAP